MLIETLELGNLVWNTFTREDFHLKLSHKDLVSLNAVVLWDLNSLGREVQSVDCISVHMLSEMLVTNDFLRSSCNFACKS